MAQNTGSEDRITAIASRILYYTESDSGCRDHGGCNPPRMA